MTGAGAEINVGAEVVGVGATTGAGVVEAGVVGAGAVGAGVVGVGAVGGLFCSPVDSDFSFVAPLCGISRSETCCVLFVNTIGIR